MWLDELDAPLDDMIMVDQSYFADQNTSNVLPQDNATLERLHNWLKPTKYTGDGSELEKHTSSHLQGTGQWLIDSSVFQVWHGGNDDGILWIRGVPGAGKSVFAARLVAHLVSEECPVLHFFFRHTIESNRRPEAALRDWIAQALPCSPPLQLALKSLALEGRDAASVDSLSIAELWRLLRVALTSISKAYFVVDALDEMDHDMMEHFLHLLDQLGNAYPDRVKLIITSRPIPTIERIVRNLKLLDIRLNNDQVSPDILKYLHHRLDQVSQTLENREAIVYEILKKADGLFLYAKLTMDTICGQEATTDEEILKALDKAPLNLSMIYNNLLRDHIGRTGLPEGLSILVLQLVTHASRPLRLLEISDCIKMTRPEYTQDIGTMKSLIRTSCGPLLEVLPDETVRVVHHSLTEYLLGLNRSPPDQDIPVFEPGSTHNVLALLCLSYLQAGCLDTMEYTKSSSGDERTYVKNPQLSPFVSYAAANWHMHVAKSSAQGLPQDEANESIFSLLMTPQYSAKLALMNKLESCGDAQFWDGLWWDQHITLEAKTLLIALHLDLNSFAKYLLSHIEMDTAAFPGNSQLLPTLHKAIMKGNLDMVHLLISKGANISHYDIMGRTPLHMALESDKKTTYISPAIVKHLLQVGADPWQKIGKNNGVEPLTLRIKGKNEGIDDANIDVDVPYPPIQQAFHYANEQVAELFLPYIKSGKAARRAFTWVLEQSGNPQVMRLLINLGIMDINSRIDGKTLLFAACIYLDPTAVEMLLKAGADPNVLHDEIWINIFDVVVKGGENVLHGLAAPSKYRPLERHEKLPEESITACFASVLAAGANAKLLLDAGADPLAMDKNGLTPLHVAYSVGVMELLVAKMDINTRSHGGRTVLLQIFSENDSRDTPRDEEPRREKALKLLDLGADPNVADNNGDGFLHYLVGTGEIVVDVNAVDDNGRTYLFDVIDRSGGVTYARGKEEEFVAAMIKAGAQFNITDIRGRTLLHAFMQHVRSNERMLELLLEQGVDPRQTDHEGNTIWHEAATWLGDLKVSANLFHNIAALGVDPRKPNNRGRTPLHVMCEHSQRALEVNYVPAVETSLFEYILEQSREGINQADYDGVLPLHILSTVSMDLTRRLLDTGADATLATSEGLNVFHLTSRCRQSNVIGLFIDWYRTKTSADQLVEAVNAKDERGQSPLYYACASGRYQSVDLLIKAGAVPMLQTSEGSYHKDRIDDILDLLINSATSVSSQAIDQAIVTAANRQHDYTVESLLRARQSLSFQEPLSCAVEVQACLERRATLLADVTTRCQADLSFSNQIERMIGERLYDAIPSFIKEYSPQPESQEFHEVLLRLSHSGYAWLLDLLLTPEVISDLEKDTGSTEKGRFKKSQDLSSLLIPACQSKQPNLHVIELLVKKGAKLDNIVLDPQEQTAALHIIVETDEKYWWQTEQALPYMLDQAVDLEIRDHNGLTPLGLSLKGNNRSSWRCRATKMLLQAGANPSSVDNQGQSCLSRAVGHESAFRLLLRHGADFDPAALAAAIDAKDVDALEMMLALGADPNARKVGWGPHSFSAAERTDPYNLTGLYPLDLLITSMGYKNHNTVYARMIELLFKHGADPNSRYPETTIAHRLLKRSGPTSNYTSFSCDRVEEKRNRYVDVIIKHPLLDIDLQDAAGTPILHAAYKAGDMKSTKLLFERGADIRVRDNSRRNILHQSPDYSYQDYDPHTQLDFLSTLITLAPELLQQVDADGRTPLHCAICRDASEEEIKLLVSEGADIHAKDTKGDTALHFLLEQEWTLTGDRYNIALDEIKKRKVNFLLSKGLDINVRNKAGDTPVFGYFRKGALKARTLRGEEMRKRWHKLLMKERKWLENIEEEIALQQEPSLWALFEQLGVDWTAVNNEIQSLLHIVAARHADNERLKAGRLHRFEFLLGKGLDVFVEPDSFGSCIRK
ncbi:hypothetical protein FOXYS1_6075 [Fusarium oxysporum]|uniref:NACHT domain-containing protein n=1 Tax=Fusarium oxysporum TaxID=5507 RepID=A0A8H5AEB2_FUSOX|nr:hypothetical protein FOXYS1_6075 [Fusarium oxysporum]